MNAEQRETIIRAAGMIEGLEGVTDGKISRTLADVCALLDEVLDENGGSSDAKAIRRARGL